MNSQNNNQSMGPMVPLLTRSNYNTFYLIMLILATIGAIFTFFGFFTSIFSVVVNFSNGKILLGILTIFNIVLGIASLVTLILLYMKKRAGFIMKMVLIVLSLCLSIPIAFVSSQDFVKEFNRGFDQSYNKGIQKTPEQDETAKSIKSFMNQYGEGTVIAITIVFSALWSIVSGLLWFFAWKSQLRHDEQSLLPPVQSV